MKIARFARNGGLVYYFSVWIFLSISLEILTAVYGESAEKNEDVVLSLMLNDSTAGRTLHPFLYCHFGMAAMCQSKKSWLRTLPWAGVNSVSRSLKFFKI